MSTHADCLLRCVRQIACHTSPEPDDAGLLARFVNCGDAAAFETLVTRHGPMVWRVCQHVLGHRHDAEDAFQATFLVLARKAANVRPNGSLAAWLHGVACRVALGARTATRRRRPERLKSDLAPPDSRPDPLAELTAREALQVLEEEVQRLPQAYRLPVVLCCLHGATQDEVARQLGWTPGSVKGRLERGRKLLHRRLAARGLGLTTALAFVEIARATAAGPGRTLVARTALAAAAGVSGNTGAGLISAEVHSLAERGLTHLAVTKVKLGLLVLIVTAAVAAGLALGHPFPAEHHLAVGAVAELNHEAPAAGQAKSPVAKEQTRKDRQGDPLPAGALARLGSARLNQGGAVAGLVFSPNGTVVASCGGDDAAEDCAIHLWEVATGKEVGSFPGHARVHRLSFSPDGKLLASGGRETSIRIWDVATGQEWCRCGNEAQSANDLAFSPDGKLLAALGWQSGAYFVTLWDTTNGKKVRTWQASKHETWSLAFSPDGATLVTAGPEDSLRLWDVDSGTQRRRIEVDEAKKFVRSPTFSPDGKIVALANDEHTIRLWDSATGRELPPLRGHKGHIKRLAFSEGAKTLVSVSADRTIRYWDTPTARELRAVTILGEVGEDFWVLALSPDEKVLATSSSWGFRNTIRLFDTTTGKPLHVRDGHTGPVEAVGFLPQSELVASVGGARVVRLAEIATGMERSRSDSRPGYGVSMILSQDFRDHLVFSPVALSRDSSLVAVPGRAKNEQMTVRIWEVASDREVGSLTGNFGSVISLAFSPDQKTLALACWDKTIRVWDTAAHKEVHRLTGHEGTIFAVAFSPDGKLLASGCTDQTARVWDLATGKAVHEFRHDAGVHAVAFSPDARSLASAGGQHLGEKSGDTSVRLWELATGKERSRLNGNHHLTKCLAFTPDGRLLALGSSDATVRVWDVMAVKELRCFEGHRGVVNSLAFSRDGKRLVSGSTDTTVLIWDTSRLVLPQR
jgi:RNA polymerase sigma factor (sigma-70 family)